jgi:hypothetical protein
MFLAVALGLALLYAALKPLSDGLLDTSAWAAKMFTPAIIAEGENAKQAVKSGQAALMEGWLSNIPFITSIVFWSSIILSFFYHWWAAIVMFFVATTFGVLTKLVWGRSVSHYLWLIYHKMVQRGADYKRDNDLERASAAESYCKDLREIMAIYHETALRPPTPKQLKDIPYGDLCYWRDHGADST